MDKYKGQVQHANVLTKCKVLDTIATYEEMMIKILLYHCITFVCEYKNEEEFK